MQKTIAKKAGAVAMLLGQRRDKNETKEAEMAVPI